MAARKIGTKVHVENMIYDRALKRAGANAPLDMPVPSIIAVETIFPHDGFRWKLAKLSGPGESWIRSAAAEIAREWDIEPDHAGTPS